MRTMTGVAMLVAVSLPTLWGQASPPTATATWSWFETCSDKRNLAIEVLLNGKRIHRSSFPICKVNTPRTPASSKQKIVPFYFKGGHVFQGEYHTSAAQTIEGNVWQAAADPDMLVLGLSLKTKKQILLNTIHYARPNKNAETTIDRDLVVRTFPVDVPPKK